MAERQIWFITRPERDPRFHAEAMKALDEATNHFTIKWQGNREIQKELEKVLGEHGLKRNNISNDGSGGRTWCAMLKTFAYCYVDKEGYLHPTKVGQALIDGNKEYENVKKQILTLQIPNAYFMESGFRPKYDDEFRIFPARFLIRLVQQEALDYYITKEEITYFALTAKKDNQLSEIIDKIVEFRNATQDEKEVKKLEIAENYDHRERSDHAARDYFNAHADVAHTFMMLCDYTGLVEYERGTGKLTQQPSLVQESTNVLSYYEKRYPFNTRYLISTERMAQNNGLDVDSYKASSMGGIAPAGNHGKLQNKIETILSQYTSARIPTKEELYPEFEKAFGPRDAKKIIETIEFETEWTSVPTDFVEKYLGDMHELEFEKQTARLLEAIGFDKVELHPKVTGFQTEIDILVEYGDYSGIIDTKYYANGFSLPKHMANHMGSEYIPHYLNYNNKELHFYGYITSEKFGGVAKLKGISDLAEKLTGEYIPGFMAQRTTLIEFLDYCLENDIPEQERVRLFIKNINNQGILSFNTDEN